MIIEQTLISIIVPIFNREDFLEETFKSVIDQTHLNWELLLVDDESTDNSIGIARTYSVQDARIKFFVRNRSPKGAPTCRNIGIEKAQGEFIIFLDSDDLLAPYCLEQRVRAFEEHSENDFLVFPMLTFKEQIDDTGRLTNYATSENDLYRFLRSDVVWQTSQPIWRKEAFIKLNCFDESFPNCQDHDLHLRALLTDLKYKKFLDDKPDAFYRNHDGEKIYQPKDPLRVLKGVNMLLSKLASARHSLIISDPLSKKNLFIFLFDATRKYTRNQEFSIPEQLADHLNSFDAVDKRDYKLIKLYISLSKLGFNKVRGYEKLWNFIIYRKRYPMTWGSRTYSGEL